MPDWLIVYLGSFQAGVMRGLAGELRAGGVGTVSIALGSTAALTPLARRSPVGFSALTLEAGQR